ncbi:increased rDNA silencing protein [Metarhizium album ARSEF 1941]|uniref:Increased rDNA silencing protein n=1 Tax=Metarhizium album (strain ARSEF 1941) TaxID=1081103 RepID=A0A0B2WU96_METAS|nr:increased rDNA silencing protein [Metarhizium album ARSEF 1941]KHN97638.1 increased rDNA silencing protein [Metarhizium album ARSEF 1941]
MNPAAASRRPGSQDDATTALRGASLAFRRSPAAGATPTPTPLPLPLPLPHHKKDGLSTSPLGGAPNPLHQLNGGSAAQLQPMASARRLDPKSPSFIAATLAASRSISPSPLATAPRRKTSFGAASATGNPDAVDTESIAPTGHLISMFEGAKADTETTREPARRRTSPREGLEHGTRRESLLAKKGMPASSPEPKSGHVRPPTPPRRVHEPRSSSMPLKQPPTVTPRSSGKISAMPMPKPKPKPPQQPNFGPNSPPKLEEPHSSPPAAAPRSRQSGILPPPPRLVVKPAPEPLRIRPPSSPSVISTSTPEVLSPKPMRLITPTLASPVLSIPDASRQADSSPSPDPDKGTRPANMRSPMPPKLPGSHRLVTSKSGSRGRRRGNSETPLSARPLTEFGLPIVSPPPRQQPVRPPRPRKTPPPPVPVRRESVAGAPASPDHDVPRRNPPANTSASHLGLDPLSNAIVAGSLASSRLTPHDTASSLPPPSLPARQKSPRLLYTLRQPRSRSDEDPERLKIAHRHKLSSNKHPHHEGSRKRWRDQITQRERRRYEAVWASNRGHLLGDDGPPRGEAAGLHRTASECVANVVVREIWKRSRLPNDELLEVWELVDRGNAGMLTRQEFIVGMWLIDQRLKGRKLPVRASDSVWASANGVRLLPKPRGR